MNEKFIQEFIQEKYGVATNNITRLMGGMSNFTYLIEIDEKKYTFRIPGKGAEHFTDRKQELEIMNLIEKYDFLPKPLYNDIETGYKIAPYVEGKPLSELVNKPLEGVTKVLKKLHSIPKFPYDYNPVDRLNYYESITSSVDQVYKALKDKWLQIHGDVLSNIELVAAHGDAQMSNFVLGENRMYLLDWEFSGNNDPIYDIACFGNNNFDDAKELLEEYFEAAGKNEYQRLYAWRMYQCLQWHNVAKYKHEIGLSDELAVDFNFISDSYLDKAKGFFQDYLEVSKGD